MRGGVRFLPLSYSELIPNPVSVSLLQHAASIIEVHAKVSEQSPDDWWQHYDDHKHHSFDRIIQIQAVQSVAGHYESVSTDRK